MPNVAADRRPVSTIGLISPPVRHSPEDDRLIKRCAVPNQRRKKILGSTHIRRRPTKDRAAATSAERDAAPDRAPWHRACKTAPSSWPRAWRVLGLRHRCEAPTLRRGRRPILVSSRALLRTERGHNASNPWQPRLPPIARTLRP